MQAMKVLTVHGVIIVKVILFDCVVAAQFNGMHALLESQLRSSQRKSVVFFVTLSENP